MDDIFTYIVDLPSNIHEAVVPCADGYTVYLNEQDSDDRRKEAYSHALKHIRRGDWNASDVQNIEGRAHS